MNVHDSERLAGLLEEAGYVPVALVPEKAARATDAGDEGADVVVVNTCSVRENAATRLFGNLGQLAAVKRERPGMQIAVGGCLAQQMRGGIVDAVIESVGDEAELEAAVAVAEKRLSRGGGDPRTLDRRVYAALARRGYPPETCSRALREAHERLLG